MSCQRTGVKISRTAAIKSGVSEFSSRVSAVSGAMANRLSRGLGRSATATLGILNSVAGPQTLDAFVPVAAVGALLSKREGHKTRQRILNALGAAQLARAVATGLGTTLGRLSRDKSSPLRQEFFFKGKPPVRIWSSRLTAAINARDIKGLRVAVQASGGQMFETEGQTWHLGTTVVKTSQGQRTLTHLQRLSVPGTHYYFDRPLPEQEVAGIVSGQKGFAARHLPGFAGQISEVEALQPAWAGLKRGLIQAHLFWGQAGQRGKG